MCSTGRSISPGWLPSRYPLVKFSDNFTACRQYNAKAQVSTINEERPTPSLAEKFDPSLASYVRNLSYANRHKNHGQIYYANLFYARLISLRCSLYYWRYSNLRNTGYLFIRIDIFIVLWYLIVNVSYELDLLRTILELWCITRWIMYIISPICLFNKYNRIKLYVISIFNISAILCYTFFC